MRYLTTKFQAVPASNWQLLAFRGALLLSVASALVLAWLLTWHFTSKSDAVDSAQRLALEDAKAASREIDNKLSRLLIAQVIADDLTSGRLPDSEVETRLISELADNPEVTAFTVCYKPAFVPRDSPNERIGRYCPYSFKGPDGKPAIARVEDVYDYTLSDGSSGTDGAPIRTAWYHQPLNEGAVWSDPYFDYAAKRFHSGFGVPFFRVDSGGQGTVPAGVVNASVSLDQFQEQLASSGLLTPGSG